MTAYFAGVLTGLVAYVTLCLVAAAVVCVREGLLRRKRDSR